MEPRDLAQLALARLPRPYTDEVTMHVFCEIERTPHLRLHYDQLEELKGRDPLNQQIGKAVKETLNATSVEQFNVEGVCELVKWPSRLKNVKSDWTWWD